MRQGQLTKQCAQQAGLAGAIGANDHVQLPRLQLQVQPFDQGEFANAQGQVMEFKHGDAFGCPE